MSFHGFISYSHAADGRLAPALQQGLHRLAKPWHRRRALWIFRDQTGLAVTPAMWSSIQHALDRSDYFVLLASPGAAASPWVNREIEHWIATRSADRILPVVTDGEWAWDEDRQDFTEDSTAVPPALRGVFDEVPLMLDLRWTHDEQRLSLQNPRFRDAIAQLAAPMHGVSKDELEGEDVRQHRRVRRLRTVAVSALLFFAFAAAVAGMFAARNAHLADVAGDETRRQQRIATEQRADAQSAAREAQAQRKNANTQRERAQSAASETRRQRQLARTQQVVAGRASAEAARQQRNAARQQELAAKAAASARRQQELARQAAARARQQQQNADRQKKIAAKAARDAARQKQEAQRQQRLAVGRRLISQAHTEIGEEPRKALMLGLAAGKFLNDTEARRELISLMTSTNYLRTIDGGERTVYSPDGTAMATIGKGGTVTLGDRRTGQMLADVTHDTSRLFSASELAFSPDGKLLAMASNFAGVVLWDVTNPRSPVRRPALESDEATIITRVSFSRDGRTIATGALGVTEITLWDVTEWAQPREISTIPGESLAFNADGVTAVSSGPDVSIWDIRVPSKPVQLATPAVMSRTAALNDSGKLMATGSQNGDILLWDMSRPGSPQRTGSLVGLADPPVSLVFSPDGGSVAAATERGGAAVWSIVDVSKPQMLRRMSDRGAIYWMAFSPDSQTLITNSSRGSATVWNMGETATSPLIQGAVAEHHSQVIASIHGRGHSLITADVSGLVIFWDLTNPSRPIAKAALRSHPDTVKAVAVSRDMRTLAATGASGEVRMWDVSDPTTPQRLGTITQPATDRPILELSPDSRTLLSGSANSAGFALWNLTDKFNPKQISTPSRWSSAAVFSPDGRSIAVADGAENGITELLYLNNQSTAMRQVHLRSHQNVAVTSLAFSHDGRMLAAGNSGRSAELWDLTDPVTPRMVATLAGHHSEVTSLAFSPDGRTVATAGPDRKVQLWDITDPPRPVRIAVIHQTNFQTGNLSFNHDGTILTAGGGVVENSASVTLWGVGELRDMRADPATTACDAAGRGLTSSEWTAYIPELDFQQTCHAPPTAITE